ncbi:MAG: hypothetical protein ACP5OG_00630 [Candidatus Nanoarchaeia archaeon]
MENQTLIQARQGKISPLEAARMLNQEIGGITAAIWNPGRGDYKILNHNQIIKLPTRGANKKEFERLKELAALAYWQAQQNGSMRPGELHFADYCSTKHHWDGPLGLTNYMARLLTKYQN